MARPSNADAQRIISLLEEFQQKLDIIAMLSYENINQLVMSHQQLEELFPQEVIEALLQHATLLGHAFKQQELKEKGEEQQEEDQEEQNMEQNEQKEEDELDQPPQDLEDQLRTSTLEVVRMLSGQPKQNLRTIIGDPTTSGLQFLQSINNLKQLFLTKLSTAVEEETGREKQLEEIKERLQKAQQDEISNKTALEKLRSDRNKTKQAREAEIKKLNEEIEQQKEETEKQSDQISKSAMQRLEKLEEDNVKTQEKMLAEINELEQKLKEIKERNSKEEAELRGKLKRVNVKVQDQIQKFDTEMQGYYDKIVRRTGHFESESSELKELKSRFDKLQSEHNRLQDEMMKEEQMKNAFKAKQQLRAEAAAYVQAHWRGLKQRADFEKMRKGRKKKVTKKPKK